MSVPRTRSEVPVLVAAGVVFVVGVLLRLPVLDYAGPADQRDFNAFIFERLGSYTDVASLYFRDSLATHPAPYFDYDLEYPVLTGAFVWLAGFAKDSVDAYFLVTALLLGVGALLTVHLVGRVPGANPWVVALSPALALHGVLNWELLALPLLVGSLVLYVRERPGWATVLLALATWSKLFPLVVLPLVLLVPALERRWREVARRAAIFTGVSLAVNLPAAVRLGDGGPSLRDGWTYAFEFHSEREAAINLWNLFEFETEVVNLASAVLAVAGVAVVALAMRRSLRLTGTVALAPAWAAALAWLMFVGKVYSPQYGLWIVVLLALVGAGVAWAAVWAAIDLVYFAAAFIALYLSTDPRTSEWFHDEVLLRAMVVREAVLLAIVAWCVGRLWRPPASQSGGVTASAVSA